MLGIIGTMKWWFVVSEHTLPFLDKRIWRCIREAVRPNLVTGSPRQIAQGLVDGFGDAVETVCDKYTQGIGGEEW